MREWVIQYERFNQTEKLLFKRLVNMLLAKTFIIRDEYEATTGRLKVHADYRFIERTFEVFSGYLELAGWTLHRDNTYGVIYLNSQHDYNKYQFNKFTTLMLLTLRLIYEERREEVSLRNEIFFETHEMIRKMQVLGILDKKPSMKDIAEGLKRLSHFNILNKIEGKWEAPDTHFLLLPSILFIISNDKISMLATLVESSTEDEIQTSDQNEDDENESEDEADASELMEDLL